MSSVRRIIVLQAHISGEDSSRGLIADRLSEFVDSDDIDAGREWTCNSSAEKEASCRFSTFVIFPFTPGLSVTQLQLRD